VLIEAFQLFSRIRVADITDALAYSLGGATGTFLIYSYESRHSPQR
jgi:glycopeptide antibiotics resistance protein